MRILLVTHYFPAHGSGVEMVAGQLAGRLAARGAAIAWAASGRAEAVPAGVAAVPMRASNVVEDVSGFAFPLWSAASLRRLAACVREADVVHLHEHLYLGNLLARRAAGRAGVPVLVTQHTSQIWPTPGLPAGLRALRLVLAVSNRTLGRWALGGADQVVFVSSRARDYFARLFPFRRPPRHVANGVDRSVFGPVDEAARRAIRSRLGWPTDRPVALFVGRMIAKKGLPTLRGLTAEFPGVHWMFAGRGPIDVRAWNRENVRHLGVADARTLADYYRAADLLVLPSLTEGFPLVVQEALACGTPAVISRDVAAGAAGVEDVVLAWDPRAGTMGDVIRAALASADTWPAGRRRAEAFARRWDWDRAAAEYWELLDDLARARPRAAA